MAHPNRLQNAHVLVFGGTSGLGFAVASLSVSVGAYVTISGSTPEKVASKVSQLQSLYPNIPDIQTRVQGYALNLEDKEHLEENLKKMFDAVTEGGKKKINHIAYTAGNRIQLPQISTLDINEIFPMFTTRLVAPLLIAKLLTTGTYMPSSPDSSFTLTGGVNTQKPGKGWTIGAAVGGAGEAAMRGLAVDLRPIRVNMVAPGAVDTELLKSFTAGEQGAVLRKMFEEGCLTGRIGRPEDVAEAYAWFMRDGFVTGSVAESNGGSLLA